MNEKPKIDYSLYLVADSALCAPYLLPLLVEQVVAHGITCVQLRSKSLNHEQMVMLGKTLLQILRPLKIPLIINDAVAVAKQIDADGVHLGKQDMPVEFARKELGPHKIIGLSLENEAQARRYADSQYVDYFGVGPVFVTTTKLDAASPMGVLELQRIRAIIRNKPLVAIGGINSSNISSVIHDVDGVAVVSAILNAHNPIAATKQLRYAIDLAQQKLTTPLSSPLTYHCVVTIAGSDSSGGAGVQADIKTISATGGYAASIITALTAQNTTGVSGIYEIPAEFVGAQLDSVFQDINFSAVKIGMLYSSEIIEIVADRLRKWQAKNIVLDPVMIAKSGDKLITDDALLALKNKLLSLAHLITPNLMETEALLQHAVTSKKQMEYAALELADIYHTNVLVKGGHFLDDRSDDVLFCYATKEVHWFSALRITSKNTHGTGCAFSAAIASYLAQGYCLIEAVAKAKDYLTQALSAGSHYGIGHGHGPLHHFFGIFSDESRK